MLFSDLKIVQRASTLGPWKERAESANLNLTGKDLVVKDGNGYPDVHLSDDALERAFQKLERAYFVALHGVTNALKRATGLEEDFSLEQAARAFQYNSEIRLYELLSQCFPEDIYQERMPINPTTFHTVQNDNSPLHVHSGYRPRLDSIAYKPSSGILNPGSFVLGNLLDVNPNNMAQFFTGRGFPYEVVNNTSINTHVTPIDDKGRLMFFYLDRILAHSGCGIVLSDNCPSERCLSVIWGETIPIEARHSSKNIIRYKNRFVEWEKAA